MNYYFKIILLNIYAIMYPKSGIYVSKKYILILVLLGKFYLANCTYSVPICFDPLINSGGLTSRLASRA